MVNYLAVFGVALMVGSAAPAVAQTTPTPPAETQAGVPTAVWELRLKDGSRAYGSVQTEDAEHIVFKTISGAILDVKRVEVVSLKVVSGRMMQGEFLPADANPTRLFFAPTGRSVKKGEGYLGVYEFFFPFVQVGITDRFSIGGGTPLFFGGGTAHPLWITPKLQLYDSPKSAVAVGILHFMNVSPDDEGGNFGIAYVANTLGNHDDALTVGVGWAYETYGKGSGSAVLMVGGEGRASRRIKFITENYLFKGGGLASGGVRFLGESLSADLGLVLPLGLDAFVILPIVNFVWKF